MSNATQRTSEKRRRELLKLRLRRIGYAIIGAGLRAAEGADKAAISKELAAASRALAEVPENYGLPRVAS